jgi:hypothetical protein
MYGGVEYNMGSTSSIRLNVSASRKSKHARAKLLKPACSRSVRYDDVDCRMAIGRARPGSYRVEFAGVVGSALLICQALESIPAS